MLLAAVSEQLSAHYGAAKMLHSRVQLVLQYLKSVQAGGLFARSIILVLMCLFYV